MELTTRKDFPQHLAVAHLQESYFYDPAQTILLFCHEAAHYLSDRHREDRAKYIFRVISFLLLANTPLCRIVEEEKDISLLIVMAEELADSLMEKLKSDKRYPLTRSIPFHLGDVSNFLRENEYGIQIFKNPFETAAVCRNWQRVLHNYVVNNPEIHRSIFESALSCIQETLQSKFLIQLFHEAPDGAYVYEVFSRIIAYYAAFNDGIDLDSAFFNICENILQAFSEAYADLRMSELAGEEFSPDWYEETLRQLGHASYYQKSLRYDAVLRVINLNEHRKPLQDLSYYDPQFFAYAAQQLYEYLSLCHNEPTHSQYVVHLLQIFKSGDVGQQCSLIREEIQKGRRYLAQHCNDIAVKYSSFNSQSPQL